MFSVRKTIFAFVAVFSFAVFAAGQASAQEKSIVVASTTSTVDSGLFDYLLPLFTQKTGIAVKVLELGTGQALDTGRRGEADVVFVHAKIAELQFVAEGEGVKRFPVMYNDFVLIWPKSDPAGVKGMKDAAYRAATARALISPNLRSGTRTSASTSRRKRGLGTNQLDRAWTRRSMWRSPTKATCCPTAARGSTLRKRGTCKSWWKTKGGYSTHMGSCWGIRPNIRM